ncbi:MAG: hypothetical protein JWM10_2333 [Myxococcaceae bacterium]|nr:hypothetical protein [Myxococcaceae bacterium]
MGVLALYHRGTSPVAGVRLFPGGAPDGHAAAFAGG